MVDSIYRITGLEDDYDDPCWSVKNRLFGICYDIRHACQGNRNVELVDNGTDDELMKWHSMILPRHNVHFSVEVLFPESLLAEVYGKLGDRKKQQKLLVSRMEGSLSKPKFNEHRHRNLADTAWKNGDLGVSKEQYMLLYDYQINNTPEAHNNIANTLYRLGFICQHEKDFDQSLCYLQQAKEHFLKSGDVLSDKVIQKEVKQ